MEFKEFLNQELWGNRYQEIGYFFLNILIGYALRKNISRFFSKYLYRIFKRFAKDELHEEFTQFLIRPFQFLILLITVYLAFTHLTFPPQWNATAKQIDKIGFIYHRIYGVLLSIAVIWLLLRVVDFVMLVLLKRAEETEDKSDDQIVLFVRDLSKVTVVVFGIFFILGAIFKLNISSLVAGLGIGGLAVALAAQDTLSNLLGSFIIFLDKPFKAGDVVSFDAITGTIEKVGFRSTQVRTLERSLLTVPNKNLVNSSLNNITLSPFRRVRFSVGLTYSTPASKIKAVVDDIKKVLEEHPETRNDFNVSFFEFGPSSLDILVVYFVESNSWDLLVKVKQEINFEIMAVVEKHGCVFAFPTQTIHLAKT